jgi:MSHA biogenesis protein MshO
MGHMTGKSAAQGFTLIELVITMVLTAIVAGFMTTFISAPVDAYRDQTRRAEMVDTADAVLRLMARDVRGALPNSVRTSISGTFVALELLATVDAARYRDSDALTAPNQELDFSGRDGAFATLGELEIPGDLATSQYYLSIYNVGVTGADAYEAPSVVMTPPGTTIGIVNPGTGESQVTINPDFQFAYGSPGKRVFLVSGPVTYLCNTATGSLTRYARYPIALVPRNTAAQFAADGISGAAVANDISACQFTYNQGTASRAGLVTLAITITRNDATFATQAEVVSLLQQVHVENAP